MIFDFEPGDRVVNPNNSMNEYIINKKLYDDKTGEVQIFNDITIGKYDVQVTKRVNEFLHLNTQYHKRFEPEHTESDMADDEGRK